jgi:hypothetical protein
VNPQPWTADHRNALLTRVTALTAGTAVVGAVGAVGLGVGIAATAQPTTAATHKATATPATAPVTTVAPAPRGGQAGSGAAVTADQVPVLVLNGIGVAGAARTAAAELSTAGFQIAGVGNLRNGPIGTSTIVYPASLEAQAKVLARATGISALDPSGSGAAVMLVVGQDWTGNVVTATGSTIHADLPAPPAPPQNGGGGGGGGNAVSGGS